MIKTRPMSNRDTILNPESSHSARYPLFTAGSCFLSDRPRGWSRPFGARLRRMLILGRFNQHDVATQSTPPPDSPRADPTPLTNLSLCSSPALHTAPSLWHNVVPATRLHAR